MSDEDVRSADVLHARCTAPVLSIKNCKQLISPPYSTANGIPSMDQESLKKMNKNKKLVKKLAKKYNAFLASDTLIKQVSLSAVRHSSATFPLLFGLKPMIHDMPSFYLLTDPSYLGSRFEQGRQVPHHDHPR